MSCHSNQFRLVRLLLLLLLLLPSLLCVVSLKPIQTYQKIETPKPHLSEIPFLLLLLLLLHPSSLWSWNLSSSHCDWQRIICTNHTVTHIFLNGMNTTVPLIISYNYNIPGEFPDILNCSKLELLDLSTNNFVGPTLVGINRLSSLCQRCSLQEVGSI